MLAAGLAPAQDQPDPGAREQQEPTYEAPSVLSRQDAFGTYARSAGAYDFAGTSAVSEMPAMPAPADSNYDGPSVLSRDSGLSQETKGAMNTFGLYAQIIGVYDSGLTTAGGKQVDGFGEETNFGANASHRWRRGKLNIEYRGSYRKYTNAPAFDGLDQFLQLTYSEALFRHLTLDLKTTLGTTTLANGAFSYFPLTALDHLGIPAGELFDSRTNYLQSRVDLTWRLTPRLSFDFGGDGFVVRRASLLLAGLNGWNVRANVAYRLTPRQTISASYDHTYYDFQGTFGASRLETAALGYSIGLTREWDLSTLAGGVRADTLGLTQVSLDPGIAALTGQSFAVVTFSNVHYLPVAEVRLTRRWKAASLTFDYSSSVTPGNGLYLTSRQTSGLATYSYIASRNLQARANAGYNQLSALGQALGTYSNLQGGVQVLYKLTGGTYIDVRYDYRHYTANYTIGDAILEMDSNRVSLGIAFSLGEASLVTW
ncbi:MAG: hypothetical protein ABSG13_08025 [Bryobacteraceae bacterium]